MYIFSLIHALLCGTYFPEALSNLQNKKVQVFNYCTALYVRWPSVPYFPGQSRFLKTSPGKKNSSPGMLMSHFWLVVPDLFWFAHLCSRMLMHRWPKISFDFICIYKNVAGSWGSAQDYAGRSHDAPADPQVGPTTANVCSSHPTICAFGTHPGLWCPNYGHLIHKSIVRIETQHCLLFNRS